MYISLSQIIAIKLHLNNSSKKIHTKKHIQYQLPLTSNLHLALGLLKCKGYIRIDLARSSQTARGSTAKSHSATSSDGIPLMWATHSSGTVHAISPPTAPSSGSKAILSDHRYPGPVGHKTNGVTSSRTHSPVTRSGPPPRLPSDLHPPDTLSHRNCPGLRQGPRLALHRP